MDANVIPAPSPSAVVLASPFMGKPMRSCGRRCRRATTCCPRRRRPSGSVAASRSLTAFVRKKANREWRVTAMAAAHGLGLAYTAWMSTGDADDRAVERVHFVEYPIDRDACSTGSRSALGLRSGPPLSDVEGQAGDPSTVVLPMLCGFIVGTLDEWLQWFIPFRVGEMHDVSSTHRARVRRAVRRRARTAPALLVAARLRSIVAPWHRPPGRSFDDPRLSSARCMSVMSGRSMCVGAIKSQHTMSSSSDIATKRAMPRWLADSAH